MFDDDLSLTAIYLQRLVITETRYYQATSGEAGDCRWNQGLCNQREYTSLKEVEIMLSHSWTMGSFVYLNATILVWVVLAYCYRQFIHKPRHED